MGYAEGMAQGTDWQGGVTFRKDDIPQSWSALTWQQLCNVWECKVRYGGNPDVARAAALLKILQTLPIEGGEWAVERGGTDPVTGEQQYMLSTPSLTGRAGGGSAGWVLPPRSLSQLAQQLLPWFDYPYGDPGKEAVKDEKGMVIEEAVNPHRGYVNPDFNDAMRLPETELLVDGCYFSLPHVACANLTWQQYRTLQAIAPQLFQENMTEEEIFDLQAQFMAYCLVPATESTKHTDKFKPRRSYRYDADRAEQTINFWKKHLLPSTGGKATGRRDSGIGAGGGALFHICFQVWQTALSYYASAYPLLFNGDGKKDDYIDALTSETNTLTAVMKYQGYTNPQEVYEDDLPNVLSALNTMAKEAKQIEQMNARIKSRH